MHLDSISIELAWLCGHTLCGGALPNVVHGSAVT